MPSAGLYFAQDKTTLKFINTGCLLLDLVIGGGWPLGRIVNIVGDKSTGKTLLAMEAAANFLRQYPDGLVVYKECESAFDPEYAKALGIPVDRFELDQGRIRTVEALIKDVDIWIKNKKKPPTLYVIDSLDAISDDAEMERDITKGTYGAAKPKLLSEFFRTRNADLGNMCLMIISQVRDNLNAGLFGKKHVRSGGKALDFFASVVMWLYKLKDEVKTIHNIKRVVGVHIKAKNDKNKVSLPFRECQFLIRFGYGIEDRQASIDFLAEAGIMKATEGLNNTELNELVKKTWYDLEKQVLPEKGKYA